MRGDIFSLFFQLFQFDQITVETLYNGHLRDIEESGHCREVERRVNVCHVWTVRQKKKKMARVERCPLRKRWGRQFGGSTQYHMILPQFFLEFGELKIATNCTIKHSYTD